MDRATDRETLKRRALIALDEARLELGTEMHRARQDYSPRALVHYSIEKHRWWWLVGVAAGGFLAMRWMVHPRTHAPSHGDGTKASPKRRGLIPGLLISACWALARRPAVEYAKHILHDYLAAKISNYSPQPTKIQPLQ